MGQNLENVFAAKTNWNIAEATKIFPAWYQVRMPYGMALCNWVLED